MSGVSISDKINKDFVFELATRGKIKVLSHQVTIEGDSVDLTGITIPAGVAIDFISGHVTFSFRGAEKPDGSQKPE